MSLLGAATRGNYHKHRREFGTVLLQMARLNGELRLVRRLAVTGEHPDNVRPD
jgi:hypothetical protein